VHQAVVITRQPIGSPSSSNVRRATVPRSGSQPVARAAAIISGVPSRGGDGTGGLGEAWHLEHFDA